MTMPIRNSRQVYWGATKTLSIRLKQQSNGSKTAAMVGASSAVSKSPRSTWNAIPYAAECERCISQQEGRKSPREVT